MDGGRVSDFSIERILSPQLGPRPDEYHRGVIRVDSANVRPPAPVQVPMQVMGCQQCKEMSFGEEWYPFYRAAFHQQNFYPNYGIYAQFSPNSADVQPLATYSGYPRVTVVAQQPLQKFRMRTVFTDSQIKQLEALFEITDYPAVETRAELARRTGLSEETVRVWFKNRRARRKRQ
ncbi:dharma [Archocentrus centrarchus]|uniref:dharma n=1 Tax=Archocentrus centrarchus TaxID=63155 RepID=UPI0011EA46B8|nr:cone-rod homeobox protein-like [Archocentrus centrarchus]